MYRTLCRLSIIANSIEGTLFAEAKGDQLLSRYGAIIIDEAHEHTVATDLLLGHLRELLTVRDDLKLIIMSATLNADLYKSYFPGCGVREIEGRSYPVEISYLPKTPLGGDETMQAIVDTVLQICLRERSGDILVFVSGVAEIAAVITKVQAAIDGDKRQYGPDEIGPIECVPLHSKLSQEQQTASVASVAVAGEHDRPGRKLIVATNVAETSITLPGVTHVVDSLLVKHKIWKARLEQWSLPQFWISLSEAKQRVGRAGRTSEGKAYRMVSEKYFLESFLEHAPAQMVQGDLTDEALAIYKLGKNPLDFPYLEPPASETVEKAQSLLWGLGAINDEDSITAFGELMTRLPVDVHAARSLIISTTFACAQEMMSIVAIIDASESGTLLFKPHEKKDEAIVKEIRAGFQHESGDHLTLFNIYMAWKAAVLDNSVDEFVRKNWLVESIFRAADKIREQLLRIFKETKGLNATSLSRAKPGYYGILLKALASGNCMRVAKRVPGESGRVYEMVNTGVRATLSKDTVIKGPDEWVFYQEYFHASGGNHPDQLRLVSTVAPEVLVRSYPRRWLNPEPWREGHIKNAMVKTLSKMSGRPEAFFRGEMPGAPTFGASAE